MSPEQKDALFRERLAREAAYRDRLVAAYRDQVREASGRAPSVRDARAVIRARQAYGILPYLPVELEKHVDL